MSLFYKNIHSLNSKYRRKRTRKKGLLFLLIAIIVLVFVCYWFYHSLLQAPSHFPTDQMVEIKKGSDLSQISRQLKNESFIRNAHIFQWIVTLSGGEQNIVAGTYYFDNKVGSIGIAERLVNGDFGFTAKQVTIPEGFTVAQIADRLKQAFPLFDEKAFIELATPREGFLFPDTYQFFPNVTPETVIDTMSENFQKKTEAVQKEIANNPDGPDLRQTIIMASLLEKEANTPESRRIISGILWKRIKMGMPLQVDATFQYFLGKNTYEITKQDLQIDSPYNTYLHTGLPIGPICNPGLDSIEAALDPTETDYLYYVSDKQGNLYYAKTLEEHQANQKKYLND